MRKTVMGVILTAAIFAPRPFAQSSNPEERVIRESFDEAIAAVKRGDAEAYLTVFSDDAVLAEMTAGQPPIVGKDALRLWITDFLSKFTFDWTDYKSEEIVIVGDVAFHRYTGTASFAPKTGGDVIKLQRRYFDSLRRDSKGRWTVWHHVWTTMPH